MKVLHAQNITGIAGSEMYLLMALPGLKAQGIDVEFLCFYPSKNPEGINSFKAKMEANGIKCHAIGFDYFPYVKTMRKVHKLVRSGNYDLLHSHLIHADFLFSYYKKLMNPRIRLVSTKHGYQEWYNNKYGFDPNFKKNNFYLRVAKFAEKQVDASIAISRGLFNLYKGLNISKKSRLKHIPYGFDFDENNSDSKDFRKAKNQLVLVGRLTAFKGHRYAIQALSKLVDKYNDIRLLFVGSGPEEESLKSLVKDLALENQVEFIGYSPHARSYMKHSDIVLVPSVSEGFGVVVLEAFSVAKPIISFDVPSLNEHIEDGINGRLIPSYDVESYARAVDDLLSDKEYSMKLGKNGKLKLESFYNLKRMTADTVSFYEQILIS